MKRILVIDDDAGVAAAVVAMLTSEDVSVECASDGREGMRLIGRGAFDLVITDLIMPVMEGVETIRAIRASRPDLPIIAMSGGSRITAGPDMLRMSEHLGATRTLRKPFRPAEIRALVSECLAPAQIRWKTPQGLG